MPIICGGFSTFSSFADDMYLLLQNKNREYFSVFLVLSIVLGIILAWIGRRLVRPSY